MSKFPLDEVRELLAQLDTLSMERQDLLDKLWLMEWRSIEIRKEIHGIVNHKRHI
jgi:hypothetical protein